MKCEKELDKSNVITQHVVQFQIITSIYNLQEAQ